MSTFIEQEIYQDVGIGNKKYQRKTTYKTILCSKFSKGLIAAFLFAIVIPTLSYYLVISRNVTPDDSGQYYCVIQEDHRIPCGKYNITEEECRRASCCFNRTSGVCHHFLPAKYFYKKTDTAYVSAQKLTPFGNELLPHLQLTIQEKNSDQISIILHEEQLNESSITLEKPKNYKVIQSQKKLNLEVLDKDGDVIFSSATGALIASKYYWEWAFQLSSDTIFGLDRNFIDLSGNETITKVIYKNRADHTTLPVLWGFQKGKFHGCVIKHDGPLEIQVLASNTIILRSLLGKRIEIELSLGPTPQKLHKQQIHEVLVPPMWLLGTHNCRNGDEIDLEKILQVYNNNKAIKFDSDCIHSNLFISLQTANISEIGIANFRTALTELVDSGTKFILSLPPHILIDTSNPLYLFALKHDILYKYQSKIIYNGTYLGQNVVYPDYSDQHIDLFIQELIKWINDKIGMEKISGIALNDNWPQNDKYGNVEKLDFPYYTNKIDNQLKYTLPWTLIGTDDVLHLEKHNLYGSAQYNAISSYLKKNPDWADLVIISSTKNYADTEPEIVENFQTSWDNFKMYLNKILFASITGNQMVGIPICGDTTNFNKALQDTLCMRWYIAAATMPYFLVSSGDPLRDPSNLNTKFAEKMAMAAMERRKMFIDYFYTILSKKEPLVRPMYYDYYSNSTHFNLERQYTIGSNIIVAHPFSTGRAKLQVYLPSERGHWYEFYGGALYTPKKNKGNTIEIDFLETDWTMFIAQGHIVTLTNSNQFILYIALDCSSSNSSCVATGELYKDKSYISLTATNSSVTLSNLPEGCSYQLEFLKVYGYNEKGGFSNRYEKNIDLCDGSLNTKTVLYVDES